MANKLEVPDPDSQYRLLNCKSCKAISGYQTAEQAGKHVYRVKCSGCGQITPWHGCKHDAQLDWNSRFGEGFQ